VKSLTAINTELESFCTAIINNTEPPVTINDGVNALDVAHQIMQKINQSLAKL